MEQKHQVVEANPEARVGSICVTKNEAWITSFSHTLITSKEVIC